MKNIFILLILVFFQSFAHAAIPFRFGAGLGGWGGKFSESYAGTKSSIGFSPGMGLHAFVGMPIHMFYVQWSPVLLSDWQPGSNVNDPSRANYFAPFAIEAGFSGINSDGKLPPLDAFMGLEYGWLGFSNGTQTSVKGTTYKIGVDYFPFHLGRFNNFGIRGEYRLHSMEISNNQAIPAQINLNTLYFGMIYAFSSKRTPKAIIEADPQPQPATQTPPAAGTGP